jgi:hypothetical protein
MALGGSGKSVFLSSDQFGVATEASREEIVGSYDCTLIVSRPSMGPIAYPILPFESSAKKSSSEPKLLPFRDPRFERNVAWLTPSGN